MSIASLLAEHQRLSILRFLADSVEYTRNVPVLQDGLEALGLSASRDQVESMAAWLEEQGLVTVEKIVEVKVVKLTRRGADVAAGRAVVPGIKRPSPGE
jgi:DNA-binding transcriptional ArsR family regulator